MNVWALDKNPAIKLFLIELIHRFGENVFKYCDETCASFQAIEIYQTRLPSLRATIFTLAQAQSRYAIDLHYPLPQHDVIGQHENLTLAQLLSIVQTHFDIS